MEGDNVGYIERLMNENPEGFYSGLGALKGLMNKPKEKAQAQLEVAKTMYSPYTQAGVGNMANVDKQDMFSNALSGYMAGSIQKKNDEFNKSILDAINSRNKDKKAGTVSDTIEAVNSNPYHQALITPEASKSLDSQSLQAMNKALGGSPQSEGSPFLPATSSSTQLPEVFTKMDALPIDMTEARAREKKKQQDVLASMQDNYWMAR